MNLHADLVGDIFRFLGIFLWIGVGIFLAHATRASGWLERACVAILFTKGFLIYWLIYVIVFPINKFIQLIIWLIAKLIDKKNRLSLVCMLILTITFLGCIDLTDTILSSGDIVSDIEPTVQEIPERIKELIWQDYEALLAELLELGIEDKEEAEELLIRIQTRQEQDLYYKKYVDAGGVAIIAADTMMDEIMEEARDIVLTMTAKRPELRKQLSPETGFYYILIDREYERGYFGTPATKLPEYPLWKLIFSKGERIVLIGATGQCLAYSENDGLKKVCYAPVGKTVRIQSIPSDRFLNRITECDGYDDYWCHTDIYLSGWKTFVHEMAHAIHFAAIQIDPAFHVELDKAYENAKQNQLWYGDNRQFVKGKYAMQNVDEYWAVASEYWFYFFRATTVNGVPVPAQSRDELKTRDPLIYNLLEKWYPEVEQFTHM